ncbi:hypothetical protein F4814DRAFT_445395 [Daldinia grandis]|nr:hypothetical protein F4814DRAFT_445395 [Daldinia grandis]
MPCTPRKQRTNRANAIFDETKIPRNEFYANAFVLQFQELQQYGAGDSLSSLQNIETTRQDPQPIENLIKDVEDNTNKERLGRNLLDSFALILARPGAAGVVAVAMEENEDRSIYTLHVSKNNASNNSPSYLAEEIQRWFNDRIQSTVENSDLSPQNGLWDDILRNGYDNISKSITIKCIGVSEDEKASNLSGALSWVKGRAFNPNGAAVEVRKSVLDVLDLLKTFFTPKAHSRILNPDGRVGGSTYAVRPIYVGNNVLILTFLRTITQLCFELVESHSLAMNSYFDDLDNELQRELNECKKKDIILERKKLLKKVRQLIYTISKYLRAWYDIARFKTHCDSATLKLNFILHQDPKLDDGILDFDEILGKAVEMRILPHGKRGSMKEWNRILSCSQLRGWDHCEMQVLVFLLDNEKSRFYNYIGCSKGPCWLCHYVLVGMKSQFKMRQSHFKLYPQWLPPKFTTQRGRFIEVFQSLVREMSGLVELGISKKRQSRKAKPDCPDDEDTFLSPRFLSVHEPV